MASVSRAAAAKIAINSRRIHQEMTGYSGARGAGSPHRRPDRGLCRRPRDRSHSRPIRTREQRMARRSLEQPETLQQRLEDEATRLREQAKLLEPGALRESLLRKARQT